MTRHIRVTLDINTDLDPGQAFHMVQQILTSAKRFDEHHIDGGSAKEVKPMGRAPISDAQKDEVISLRQSGGTYPDIARLTGLSRASVIRICKAENAD